jgi:pimeloyl-ACP methyl ester carboxylesterase
VQLYSRDVGGGTPLILLHAFPLSSAMWLGQREGLASRLRVITPDLRGFGGSPLGDDAPSIDVMADDIAELLDSKGIERAVVGGVSLGGHVAIAFSRRHPDRLLGAVLSGVAANPDPEPDRRDRLHSAERLEAEENVNALLEDVLPHLVGPTTLRQRALIYGRVKGLVQATPPHAAAWAQRALAAADAIEVLADVTSPVLVIAGEEDVLATEADARAVVAALPNAELTMIPRSGHLTPVEQTRLFNEVVSEFASAVGRTAD